MPTPLKFPKRAVKALSPPKTMNILGFCPVNFLAKLGSTIGRPLSLGYKIIAASQAGEEETSKKQWDPEEVSKEPIQPPGMFPVLYLMLPCLHPEELLSSASVCNAPCT